MNRYTCFPSEGGHAECAPALLRLLPPRRARINASLHSFLRYAPIDDLTHDLRDWMMHKFLFTGDNKGRHKEDGASATIVSIDSITRTDDDAAGGGGGGCWRGTIC